MADANARINIDINTSAAAAGLRQLQSQITAFNSTLTKSSAVQATAMRNSTSNMLELVNASRFFTGETVRMQTAAASLDTTLKKGQITLGTFLGAKFRKNSLAAAQVMSLANTRAQALQTQFVATGAAANGMRDAIAIRPLQAFNNAAVVSAQKLAIHRAMLNQATTSMINFGKNTQWTGRQLMVGFTVPLTIFGGVAGKVFRDLEKEAVNFKKVYGDSFTPPEEMEANLNAVKELAKEYTKYGIAVKDTVGLAAEAAAAGAQNAELIDATTQATRLATLGQMEQNEALKTTISLQNAFKLSGDELANSINFLNMVENQTVVTLQDLSGAIPRVAPVIKGLGGDVRDLATFLAAMQEGGVSAAQGSMALKSGLASLINPTEKAKERLAEMGISIDTIIQANKGDLMGTVQSLAAALDTLDQFGRQQAIEELFGKFQYARLAALFDNINKEGTQAARVMEISAMSAAEMAASAEKELGAIEEAVGTKFVAAMEQLKLAIAPIGELFTKMAIPVINLLAKIADAFNNLPDGSKTFIGIATAIVGIVIPAGTMFLGLLVNLIGTLVKFGSAIGTAFRGFLSGGIKGAFDAVSQSTKYMSLAEIDAANSAQQLAGSTEAVNRALLGQVGSSETAQAAIMELAYAYEILTQQMREAAAQNNLVFGTGAAAMGAAGTRGPRVRRNRGGTIPGSGNTDTVPAMLTPGEFVVNKQATQDNLPLLKAINKGGNVPGFMGGGLAAMQMVARGLAPLTGGIGRAAVSLPARASGSVRARISSRLYSQYQQERGATKNARLMKYAVDELGINPAELKLSTRSSYGFLLSRDANEAMKKGILNRSLLSSELLESGALAPLQTQLRRNLGHSLNDKRFIEILEQQISRTSKRGLVSNQTFEQASGRALAMYLSETNIPISAQRNFMRSVFKKTELSANLPRERLKSALDARGVSYREDGKNLYAMLDNGTEINLGNLTGREMGVFSKPAGFARSRSYKIKGDPRVFAHGRNSGGGIPGKGGKVPAMLTPGEFVVNKDAAQSNMAFLNAINNGTLRGYELGGLVEALPGQYLVEGRNGRTFGPMSYNDAMRRSKQLVSARARRSVVVRRGGGASTGIAGRGMGMMGGRGMGLSMLGGTAMMGGMMIPGVAQNQAASSAIMGGGMLLSMAPMLAGMGPAGLAIAGVAAAATAAGVALYKWRDGVDTASRKAAEFGANLGGTANALNNVASIMGQQTPSQRQAQLQLGISDEDIKNLSESTEFQNVFTSEAGQKFISDLEAATSAERFQKLSDYLRYAIAAGIMDASVAESFAKGISAEIGDSILGTQVATAIRGQEAGPQSIIDLGEERIQEASSTISKVLNENSVSYQDASKAIGAATQIIQDFSNAEALAQEQFVQGAISYEELQSVVNQSRDVQNKYTDAISDAMSKTSDFGGTMQAVKDQLISAGIVTEEQFSAIESAAKSAGGPRTQAGKRPSQTREVIDTELMAAAQSALFSGISPSNVEEITKQIASGEGQIAQIYQSAIEQGQGGGTAFETAAGATEISRMITGAPSAAMTQRTAQERTQKITLDFVQSGGDITALTSLIASIPEDGRFKFMLEFDLLTPEQQSQYIADSQKLASVFGSEFANTLQQSDEYKKALEQGTTEQFNANMEKTKEIFGEASEEIFNYSEKTGKSIQQLTEYGEDLQGLGQEAIFKLGIDITNPQDLERFGPIADTIRANWPILQKLNPNLDLSLYINYLTLDAEGNEIDPMTAAKRVKEINNAWKEFEGAETIEARKTAYLELMTLQNGQQVPEATYNEMWENLIADFGEGKVANMPSDRINKIFEIDAQIRGAETMIEALRGMAAAAYAGGDFEKGNEYISKMQDFQESIKNLEGQRVSVGMFGKPRTTSGGGGGGGQKEKTIPEMLKEEMKLATGFANQFGRNKIGKIMGKPFGPEFLEFIKSQGEKGLKFIKGNFKKFKDAYNTFEKTQKALSLQTLQFMPGKLAEELQGRKDNLALVKMIAQEEGMSLQTAIEAVNVLDANQQKEYLRLVAKKKLTDQEKEHLALLKQSMGIAKETALFDEKNAEVMKFMNMSAEERESARISNLQDIQNINRQIEEINVLEPLQKQLDAQQKIIDASQRAIELKQRESEEISRAIELKERELEPLDEQIEKLEEQQDKVQEIYDEQIEALDKIFEQESEIIALREKSLDVADALSTGDIAAAARAQMQLQSELAAQRREDQRSLLEAQNEAEIAAIDEQINDIKEQRVAIEEEVERLQLKQRRIQDEIYKLNQSQIPVQDEIYRLQQRIASETDRLNSKYNDTNLRLQSLNQQLKAALETQNAINNAAAEENRIRQQKAQQAAAVAPPAPAGVEVLRPGDSGYDQVIANVQELYGGRPNEMVSMSQDQLSAGLGGVGTFDITPGFFRFMYGGSVNYRGSREAPPGMMYGGKMKKYASGSWVSGTGMLDSVPAMLTPGEFVVRKPVAQKYGNLLQSLNGQVFPRVNFRQPMPNGSASESGSMYNYNVNVTLNGSDMNPDDVANAVMRKIKMTENTRVRGYNTRG